MDSNLVNTVSHDNNKEYAYADVFYAKIKKISTYNGILHPPFQPFTLYIDTIYIIFFYLYLTNCF